MVTWDHRGKVAKVTRLGVLRQLAMSHSDECRIKNSKVWVSFSKLIWNSRIYRLRT